MSSQAELINLIEDILFYRHKRKYVQIIHNINNEQLFVKGKKLHSNRDFKRFSMLFAFYKKPLWDSLFTETKNRGPM